MRFFLLSLLFCCALSTNDDDTLVIEDYELTPADSLVAESAMTRSRWGGAGKWTKNAVKDTADWTKNAAKDTADWTENAAKDTADWTKNAAEDTAEWTKNAAEDVKDATEDAATAVGRAAKNSYEAAKDLGERAWNAAKEEAEKAFEAVKRVALAGIHKVEEFINDMPNKLPDPIKKLYTIAKKCGGIVKELSEGLLGISEDDEEGFTQENGEPVAASKANSATHCVNKEWVNDHGHTCADIAKDKWAKGDWIDKNGVRADAACCKFGGGATAATTNTPPTNTIPPTAPPTSTTPPTARPTNTIPPTAPPNGPLAAALAKCAKPCAPTGQAPCRTKKDAARAACKACKKCIDDDIRALNVRNEASNGPLTAALAKCAKPCAPTGQAPCRTREDAARAACKACKKCIDDDQRNATTIDGTRLRPQKSVDIKPEPKTHLRVSSVYKLDEIRTRKNIMAQVGKETTATMKKSRVLGNGDDHDDDDDDDHQSGGDERGGAGDDGGDDDGHEQDEEQQQQSDDGRSEQQQVGEEEQQTNDGGDEQQQVGEEEQQHSEGGDDDVSSGSSSAQLVATATMEKQSSRAGKKIFLLGPPRIFYDTWSDHAAGALKYKLRGPVNPKCSISKRGATVQGSNSDCAITCKAKGATYFLFGAIGTSSCSGSKCMCVCLKTPPSKQSSSCGLLQQQPSDLFLYKMNSQVQLHSARAKYDFVADKKECAGKKGGSLYSMSVQDCAATCKAEGVIYFVFHNCGLSSGCPCVCEKVGSSCTQKAHKDFTLYKMSSFEVARLTYGTVIGLWSPAVKKYIRMSNNAALQQSHERLDGSLPSYTTGGSNWNAEKFKVVDAGGGEIALWSPTHKRFVRMSDTGMDRSAVRADGKLPSSWTWERFKVVDARDGNIALWSTHRKRFISMPGTGKVGMDLLGNGCCRYDNWKTLSCTSSQSTASCNALCAKNAQCKSADVITAGSRKGACCLFNGKATRLECGKDANTQCYNKGDANSAPLQRSGVQQSGGLPEKAILERFKITCVSGGCAARAGGVFSSGYVGCFKDNSARAMKVRPYKNGKSVINAIYTSKPEKCMASCASSKYVALQANGQCFCDNHYGNGNPPYDKVPDSECDSGKSRSGGTWRNAVYSNSKETYEGCFKACGANNKECDFSHRNCVTCRTKQLYDPEGCMKQCRQFPYIAMQGNGRCYCGNHYGTPKSTFPAVSDSECAKQGNGPHLGDTGRNAVYSNRFHGTTSVGKGQRRITADKGGHKKVCMDTDLPDITSMSFDIANKYLFKIPDTRITMCTPDFLTKAKNYLSKDRLVSWGEKVMKAFGTPVNFVSDEFNVEDQMFLGPSCNIDSVGIQFTATLSFGAAKGVGGEIAAEVGFQVGCMEALPKRFQGGSGGSGGEQAAARVLGYNKASWDSGTEIDKAWHQLSDVQRAAAAVLGYTATTWNNDSGSEPQPASTKKSWDQLSRTHSRTAGSAPGSKRWVVVPVWGFSAAVSAGFGLPSVGVDANVYMYKPFAYFNDFGHELALGASIAGSKASVSADVIFGCCTNPMNSNGAPLKIITKNIHIGWPINLDLTFPTTPFMQVTPIGGSVQVEIIGTEATEEVQEENVKLIQRSSGREIHTQKGLNGEYELIEDMAPTDLVVSEPLVLPESSESPVALLEEKEEAEAGGLEIKVNIGYARICRHFSSKAKDCFRSFNP